MNNWILLQGYKILKVDFYTAFGKIKKCQDSKLKLHNIKDKYGKQIYIKIKKWLEN